MLDTKAKEKFIELRAAGLSYEKIRAEMNISKATCHKLKDELSQQIDEVKRAEIKSLIDSFGMVRVARVKSLGKLLQKLDAAIEETDFSKVPADKLLELRLKYMEAFQKEIILPRQDMTGATPEEITTAYVELINEVRKGNLTTEQAAKENMILGGLLKAIETTELKSRIEEIEAILNKD